MRALLFAISLAAASPTIADESAFHAGSAIPAFGKVATIEGAAPIPADASFKIRFDVSKKADPAGLNRTFESDARFINMHEEAGVARDNINLAVVIHGGAVNDVTKAEGNANAPLIAALSEHGVKFYVCGQSAAYYDVAAEDMLPGAAMSLSAMTAHALLDAEGYSFNPF